MEKIEKFISTEFKNTLVFVNGARDGSGDASGYSYLDGSGDGSGDGYTFTGNYTSGYGCGSIDGYGGGYGDGDDFEASKCNDKSSNFGYRSGSGCGSNNGCGYGYGTSYSYNKGNISKINGQTIYYIDALYTIILSVHGNYAKGFILKDDLTKIPCYIAKVGNFFAHGETLRQAFLDVQEKYNYSRPIKERIAAFNMAYPDRNKKVPASELFSWHHILTGSCLLGRQHFCEEKGIDYKNGSYTVNEFIALTQNAYRNEIIKQLENSRP